MLKINQIYKVKEGHEGKCNQCFLYKGKYIRITDIETDSIFKYNILDKNKQMVGFCASCFTENDLEPIEKEVSTGKKSLQLEKTLKQLIEEQKFDYVDSDITEKNFPISKREHGEYKVYSFNKQMSSEDVIKEMEKDGYSPATLLELLEYKGDEHYLVALGSVCELGGNRRVPALWYVARERGLGLHSWDGDWDSFCRFLSVRTLPIKSLESDPLPLKTLDNLEVGDEVIVRDWKKMLEDINELVDNDFGFDLQFDEKEYSDKDIDMMRKIILSTYQISHCVYCKSCQNKYKYKISETLSPSEAETLLEEKLGYKVKIK